MCCEKWFDMKVNSDGICQRCQNPQKASLFSESNHLNPGPSIQELAQTHGLKVPEPLSQVEEIMISPVHVMMQAWIVKGGQSKYTGHCCSFINDVTKIVQKVPTLPEHLDVAIIRAKTTD